jgi:hypothetical protein
MRDSASATPSLHPAYLINKLNNYVKELNIILPNGTNIGGLKTYCFSSLFGGLWAYYFLAPLQLGDIGSTTSYPSPFGEAGRGKKWEGQKMGGAMNCSLLSAP